MLSGLAGLIWIALSVQCLYHDIPDIHSYMAEMNTLAAMLYGVGMFVFLTTHYGEKTTGNQILAVMSRQSFGIYAVHLFLLEILIGAVLPYKAFHERLPLIYTLTLFILNYGLSFLLTLGMSKVKGVRKLVRG